MLIADPKITAFWDIAQCHRSTSTRLPGGTAQKAVIFIFAIVRT
jgi:hypothetical protein